MQITEQDVQKSKELTKSLFNDDELDLSHITVELLSKQAIPVEGGHLNFNSYYGNRWFGTSDPRTAENLIGFHSDPSGQDACGETIVLIPSAYYTISRLSRCPNGYETYEFRHR